MELNGRTIDTSCPYVSQCWVDQFCPDACPDTLYDVLKKTALLEHENEMTPHTDPDLQKICPHMVCRVLRGELTVNQAREELGYG